MNLLSGRVARVRLSVIWIAIVFVVLSPSSSFAVISQFGLSGDFNGWPDTPAQPYDLYGQGSGDFFGIIHMPADIGSGSRQFKFRVNLGGGFTWKGDTGQITKNQSSAEGTPDYDIGVNDVNVNLVLTDSGYYYWYGDDDGVDGTMRVGAGRVRADGNKWNASPDETWDEWPSKSMLGVDDRNEVADTFLVYWDTTFLYIGYEGFSYGSQDLFVALDVGSTSGETDYSDPWDGGYHYLPFKADYLLTVEGTGFKAVRNALDTEWNSPGDGNIKGGTIGSFVDTTFSEFRVRWSNLGGFPRTLGILAYQKWDAARNISHSFPTQNPASYTAHGDTLAYFYHWENFGPDSSPRADSRIRRGTVKMNEVLWNSAVSAEQYIELHNPRSYILDISNYTFYDLATNNTYSFPANTMLDPGKYVVFHPQAGTNTTDSFGIRHFYSTTGWDIGGAGTSNDSGALELYRGSQLGHDTMIDFVTWSSNGSIGQGVWDDTALRAGIWRAGAAIDVQTTTGNTDSPLIRKTDGLDSDDVASAEWQQIELTFLPGITNTARGGPTSITSVAFKDSDFSTDRSVYIPGETIYIVVTATNINTSNTEAVVVEIDGSGNLDLVAYENGTNSSTFRGILRTLLGSSTTYASAEDSVTLPSAGGMTARTKIDATKTDSVNIDTYPYLTRSTYSHKNKELFLYFTRPIDTSTIDVTRCTIQASSSGSGNVQNLSGATVKNGVDSLGFSIVLTNAQRNTVASWEDSTLFVAVDSGAAFGTSTLNIGVVPFSSARALDSYVTGYDTAVKINEVYPQAGSYADSAFIELFFLNNTEFGWIDLKNWYVAERADTRDFFISPSINMGPGDYVTIYRDTAPNNINLAAATSDSGIYYSGSNFFVQSNFNQVALYSNRYTVDSRTIVDYFAWHRSDTAGETMPEMIHAIDTGIWTAYDSFSYTAASDVSGSQKSMMLSDNGVDSNTTTNWTQNTYTPGRTNRVNDPPTVAAADIIMSLGSGAFVPGDTYRIRVKYTDVNHGSSIERFDLRITNGTDTIWFYSVRGDTAVALAGAAYLTDSVTLDTSVSGNDVTCTWKLAFDWDFVNATNYLIGARATDTYVDTGAWTDSTISWTYSNVMTLSGTLTGTGVTNGAVDTNSWFQAGQSVTWAGLTVYMKNTTVSPKTYFCTFTIADDSNATDTQTDSFVLNVNKFVSTVTDTTESVVIKLVNVPSPGTFDTTTARYSQTFRVDDTVPTMNVRDETYVFKADTFTRAPAIKVDFYTGDSVSLLDTAQYQVGGTWYDLFTADADSRVGDWFLSGPAYAALDTVTINTVAVRLYDQAGWSVTRNIYIYYEPITINGDVGDWQGDEKMQVDSNENIWFMLAWDDTCLYLGYQPKDINTSNNGDFFVYMDIMPESGINTSINWGGGGIHNLPSDTGAKWDANFSIEDSAGTPGIEFQQVLNNSSWRLMLNRNDIDTSAGWGRVIGTAGVPYTEVRIPWMHLTNNKKRPDSFNIVAFQQYETESNVWTSYPTANPGGGSEADLTFMYQFLDASDTFSPNSLIKTLVNIDAGLADWPDTTILPAYGVRDYRLWWDGTFLYAAVNRGSAFPTTASNDVIQIYIDTGHVSNFGAETSVGWSGVHNLPPGGLRPDYAFIYAPNNGGGNDYTDLRKWRASDSAWVGGQTWNGAVAKNNSGGIAEISIPWKDLGDTPEAPITKAKFLLYTNQGDNGDIRSAAPNANPVDSDPVSFTAYIAYDSLTPVPTKPNSNDYLRTTAVFRDAGDTKTRAFTPFIDGAKDPAWNTTPDTSGLGSQRPTGVVPDVGEDNFTFDDTGLARGIYLTNDITNLYIGWEAMGRHYDKENGVSEPGHYMFVFFTDTNPAGTPGDPWKTGVSPTTRVYNFSADFWANAWMGYQSQDYGGMTLYKSKDTNWTSIPMTGGTDFKVSESNRWGELKVSLTTLGLKVGDTVGILHLARHADPKRGISDITPFQGNAVSTWSDTDARIDATRCKRYVIQPASNSNVYHRPADQPVAGKETMRNPVTSIKSQTITITAGSSPIGNYNNLFIVYSKDTWATSDSVAMASAYQNGADEFFEGVIPAVFARGDSVRYYIEISEAQINYVYGDNSSSTVTLTKATAQNNSFVFSVINAVPTALDSVTLTPATPTNNSNLNATCTGSVDQDGETLFYQFEWYRNHTPVTGLVFLDTTPPYTDTVSSDSTSAGDLWYCRVSVGDGRETSAATQSNAAKLGLVTDWTGTAPVEINTARVTDSEWIWLDKSNEERTLVASSGHFDITQCRLKMDTENLYFRIYLRALSIANYPNVVISIDTDGASGSGNATIGDESQTSFGDSYLAPALAAEVQLVLHTFVSDSPILEIQTAAGWSDTTSNIEFDTTYYLIEGKIARSAIGLTGADTVQVAIAAFKNRVGKASAINSTVEFPTCDAFDAVSISARNGTASFANDGARTLSAEQEDLSDGDVDFWAQLRFSSAGLMSNFKPNVCTGPYPRSGDTIDVLTPTLRWTRTTDSDADDTVTSYMIELGTDTNLDGAITFRVNVSGNDTSYTIPADLTTNTIYYWRVRARDRTGTLSDTVLWNFRTTKPTITANRPVDVNNLDNMNRYQDKESSLSTIYWRWAPSTHSNTWVIQNYAIEISDDSVFASITIADTLIGTAAAGCTTSYKITSDSGNTLSRGRTYYARVRGGDTASPQNWSPNSQPSDGIYYSMRTIDGDSNDWAPNLGLSISRETYIPSKYEAAWKDSSGDHRLDNATKAPFLDVDQFRFCLDPYNLYIFTKFFRWEDGTPYIQVAIDIGSLSSERAFLGRNIFAEDGFVNSTMPWEYLIGIRTGNDDVTIYNQNFTVVGEGRYTENSQDTFVEICIPLSLIGGAAEYTSDTFRVTPTIFWNDNGGIGQFGANNANFVDVVTLLPLTWTDVSDQTVDHWLSIGVDSSTRASGIRIDSSVSTSPTNPSRQSHFGKMRDIQIYNMWISRWWDGRSDNQRNGASSTSKYDVNGDLQGVIDYIKDGYWNWFGITHINFSPALDFGSNTGWGYDPKHQYQVDWSYSNPSTWGTYGGFDEYVRAIKEAKRHNLGCGQDWITPHSGGSSTYLVTQNSGNYLKSDGTTFPMFGDAILPGVAESRQYFSDHARFLYAMGMDFLRVDNAKFTADASPPERGLPFYAYWGNKLKNTAPDLYSFGEAPSGPDVQRSYCSDGNRLIGMIHMGGFDERLKGWATADWSGSGNTSDDLKSRWESDYAELNGAGTPVMTIYYENHDHDRAYHYTGDAHTWGKSTGALQMIMYWEGSMPGVPYIFYGDELVMMGKRGSTYPDWQPTGDLGSFGTTRRFPWNHEGHVIGQIIHDGSVGDVQATAASAQRARQIFPAFRYDQRDQYWSFSENGKAMAFIRGRTTSEEVLVLMNASQLGARTFGPGGIAIGALQANKTYKDWFSGGTATTDGSGNLNSAFSVGNSTAAYLKVNSFGKTRAQITVQISGVNQTDAIVSIDDKAVWTRESKNSGTTDWIVDIVTSSGGTTQRRMNIWKAPYEYRALWNFTDGVDVTSTIDLATDPLAYNDATAPGPPNGLMAVARDRAVELEWPDNPSSDTVESYYIYRSKTPNDANPPLFMEVIRSTFFDNDLDRKLVNGDTYYYKVRARDRNGNTSGFSNEISATPGTVKVTFQTDVTGAPGGINTASITKMYVAGNPINLGKFDFNNNSAIRYDAGFLPVQMTLKGRGIYEAAVNLDPTLSSNYIFIAEINSGGCNPTSLAGAQNDGDCFVDYNAAGNTAHWNTYTYEPSRQFLVPNTPDRTFAIVNRFNVVGDQAPQAPQGLSAVPRDGAIRLGWSFNLEADISHYEIHRSTDGITFTLLTGVGKDVISYTNDGLTNGTTYYYRMKAADINKNFSSLSDSVFAKPSSATDDTAPAKPAGVKSENGGLNTVVVKWDYNTEGDLAGYNVYRSTTQNFNLTSDKKLNGALITPTFSPLWSDSTAQTNTQYYYAVTSVDDFQNESDSSTVLSAKLARLTFIVDVGNITTNGNVKILSNDAYITWSGKSMLDSGLYTWTYTTDMLTGFALQYLYFAGDTQEKDYVTSSRKREVTVPSTATKTYFDDWQEDPDVVANLRGEPDSGAVWLFWDANTKDQDLIGYNVYQLQLSGAFTKVNAAILANTNYQVTGLTNATAYSFAVRAVDTGALVLESPNSNVVNITPGGYVYVDFKN